MPNEAGVVDGSTFKKNGMSGIQIPPMELIQYTCGTDDPCEYVRSGQEVATMFTLAATRYGGALDSQGAVLDFGCGSGRLLGGMNFGQAPVTGCDVGAPVAAFSKEFYPNARVFHTDLMPPLPFSDGEFGLVYSFSVFSHLTEEVERAWLEELRRVGSKDCLYLITVQGEWMIEATLEAQEQADIRRRGFGFKKVHGKRNDDLDFPDYYESSYHTKQYICDHWSKLFNIIDMIKGDDPRKYLYDGLKFESEGGCVPDFRPMGQDLVIARRR
jgi:SAM-dependent methyltransferase